MKIRTMVLLSGILALLSIAVAATAQEPNVLLGEKEGIGPYLADSRGMTLYRLTRDTEGYSTCGGPCLAAWPEFYVEKVVPGAGLRGNDFSVIDRTDGRKQVTYEGMPLYYYVEDTKPGDTSGQGRGGVWFAATP